MLAITDISIMLVNKRKWQRQGQLLTAIETEELSTKHQQFNHELLEMSGEIAQILDCKMHLVNC